MLVNTDSSFLNLDGSLNREILYYNHRNFVQTISTKIHMGLDQNDNWRYVIGDKIIVDKYFKGSIENVGEINNLPINIFQKNFYDIKYFKKYGVNYKEYPKIRIFKK